MSQHRRRLILQTPEAIARAEAEAELQVQEEQETVEEEQESAPASPRDLMPWTKPDGWPNFQYMLESVSPPQSKTATEIALLEASMTQRINSRGEALQRVAQQLIGSNPELVERMLMAEGYPQREANPFLRDPKILFETSKDNWPKLPSIEDKITLKPNQTLGESAAKIERLTGFRNDPISRQATTPSYQTSEVEIQLASWEGVIDHDYAIVRAHLKHDSQLCGEWRLWLEIDGAVIPSTLRYHRPSRIAGKVTTSCQHLLDSMQGSVSVQLWARMPSFTARPLPLCGTLYVGANTVLF